MEEGEQVTSPKYSNKINRPSISTDMYVSRSEINSKVIVANSFSQSEKLNFWGSYNLHIENCCR